MATLTPVDFDPFEAAPMGPNGVPRVTVSPKQPKLTEVDFDPFATAKPGYAEDMAKSFAGGVGRGVSGLVGLPGDLAELGAQGIDWATRKVGGALGVDVPARAARPTDYGSRDVAQGIETFTGPFYKPQTTPGQYANTIGEFAPAAVIGPGGAAARAAQVVVPALASESAGQLTKGSAAEPWARAGGALAGGIGTSLAMRPGTTAQAVRQQLPEGVTPQMVDQAGALIQRAEQQGVTLSWPEALSQTAGRPVMTNAMRHLEAAPQTEARMAEFYAGRPQQVEQAARGQFDNIAPPNMTPDTIGPQAGRAAEGFANDVRGAINQGTQPLYDASRNVLLNAQEMAQVRALPGYAEAARAVRSDPQLARYTQGQPENSVGFLNEVKKYLDNAADNASAPVNAQRNMQRSAGYGQDAAAVRGAAERASPEYGQALATQSWARENVLQPILDGPIGKLASRDPTTKSAIDALFPANPLPNSQAVIADTMGVLAARSPRVARDLVRSHAEGVFNEASQALQSGANQMGGAKFVSQLVGNPQQRANLQAAVEALPHGADRWRGFENMLEVLQATGTRANVGSRTAYNAEMLKSQATSGVVGEAAKGLVNPFGRGAQFLAEKYERYRLGANLNELATILTDPRAANQLRAIARMPVNSASARNVTERLLTQMAGSRD
jgi:hypothetical protein